MKMMRGRIEKHWREEREMNGKDEEGGVKGLREDCACLIIEIIICNHLSPKKTSPAIHRGANKGLFPIIPEKERDIKRRRKQKHPQHSVPTF